MFQGNIFPNYHDAYNGYSCIETPVKDKTGTDIVLKMYEERLNTYQNNILLPAEVTLSKIVPEEHRFDYDDVQFLKQLTNIKRKIHHMHETNQ